MVFNRENGVSEHRRNVRVSERSTLTRFHRGVGRQHLRLKPVGIKPHTTLIRDLCNLIVLIESDPHKRGIASRARTARLNLDRTLSRQEASAPHIAGLAFKITGAAQQRDQTLARERLACPKRARRGVDSGAARQITVRQARIDDS
jgi:hypothetical protein